MPTTNVNGIDLHYVEHGSGDETVVMSHSYVVDHRHFDAQIAALASDYRVIAYDHRDHGQSGSATAPYEIDALVSDAVGLIEHTGAAPCHWIGLSTGGFVGTRLAIHHRELLRSLVLMDTSADAEPLLKRIKYHGMLLTLRLFGTKPLLGSVMGLMFSPVTRRDPERRDEMAEWRQRIAANDRHGLIRFGKAIFARKDVREPLSQTDVPTLVVVGEHDDAQAPARSRVLADTIRGAQLEVIPDAGHLSTVDNPEAVNAVLLPFLEANRGAAEPAEDR